MFEFFVNAFNLILYQPLFNALILLYEYLPGHDFGLAVIFLTVAMRMIFYPLMVQSIKSQKALSELQPKIQEIQKKYKDDREKQAKAMIEIYQKEKINPFSGCLPLFIQLPILIALYRVFWQGLQPEQLFLLYSFVPHPGVINPTFFGFLNLSQPSLVLALLAGISQFFQTKMISPKIKQKKGGSQFSEMFQKQMLYFFPIFTVFILWRLPAALSLYWLVTTLFSIFQQYLVFKKYA
ncbi:MAG: YidC/Oxa1 family membrane protein insertase [Patescibacteria group bacterium]|nr:YidC/Oxa1 family membrane protein insertase [Patescibacteria group bacterium]